MVTIERLAAIKSHFDALPKPAFTDALVQADNIGRELLTEVWRLRAALEQVAHEHQAYDDPANRGHDLSYATGVTDGHRCAAKIAKRALGEQVNE